MQWRALIVVFGLGLIGGGALSGAQVRESPAVQIAGTVQDSAGSPVPSAVIELHSWNGALLATQVSGAGGQFAFTTRDPGPYQISVSSLGVTATVNLENNTSLGDVVVPMPARGTTFQSQGTPDTVSLNDLEAPSRAKSKLDDARKAMDKLQLDKAWRLVNDVIRIAPNWGRAYLYRGVLNMESENFASARSDLAIAVDRNPKDTLALTELGKLYASTGRLDLADFYLRRALAEPPVLWPTYFELANVDIKRGNYAEAEQMANAGMMATPAAPPQIHFLAAEAAEHLGETATAQREYRAFLALIPANSARLTTARKMALDRLAVIH